MAVGGTSDAVSWMAVLSQVQWSPFTGLAEVTLTVRLPVFSMLTVPIGQGGTNRFPSYMYNSKVKCPPLPVGYVITD